MENKSDYNERAAKGQAFNLAVHAAIGAKEETNKEYILELYLFYRRLGALVQNYSEEEISSVLVKKGNK